MGSEQQHSGLKERIKDLFDMHREERRGVLVLMVLLLGLTAWVVYEQWLRPPKQHDLADQDRNSQCLQVLHHRVEEGRHA